MKQYRELLETIIESGNDRGDRTGTGTRSIFGYQMVFDLGNGFPLVTGKKTLIRPILHELVWFLRGQTNIKYLVDNDVHIWDEWADADGNLGPVYGKQWRSWPAYKKSETLPGIFEEYTIDQIQDVIDQIKNNPESRRLIVTAWNPAEVPDMKLPPCHCFFQFYCTKMSTDERNEIFTQKYCNTTKPTEEILEQYNVPEYKLSVQMYQRSVDTFLGLPFNIASYAALLKIIAKLTNTYPHEFIWTGGDCHIYQNHIEQVKQYLELPTYDLPELEINGVQNTIDDIDFSDFELVDYQHGPFIKAPIAV